MTRHLPEGLVAWRFLTTAPNDLAAPTIAELDAGVDLVGTKGIEAMISADGWEKTANSIPVPDMSSQEVGNIGGDEVYPQSSITFYKSNSSEIIYSALPEGTSGYVVKMLDGQVATKESEVFKVEVATRTRPTQRSQAARFVVNFTVDPPTKGAVAA